MAQNQNDQRNQQTERGSKQTEQDTNRRKETDPDNPTANQGQQSGGQYGSAQKNQAEPKKPGTGSQDKKNYGSN